MADKLVDQYVEVYDFSDRLLVVRWKVHPLPYRVFSKDQRVSHTAIIENRHLSHAFATVKAQQDLKHLPKIMTNCDRGGYKKWPRQVYEPDHKESATASTVEMTSCWDERNMKPFPSHPTVLGNRQTTSISTLRTARRLRRFMEPEPEPLCGNSSVVALPQHKTIRRGQP